MSFRLRLTLVAAAAVALAVVLAAPASYFVVKSELRGQVDDALQQGADRIVQVPLRAIRSGAPDSVLAGPRPDLGGARVYIQIVQGNGTTFRPPGDDVELPVDAKTLAVARAHAESFFTDLDVAGASVRVVTVSHSDGYAVQLARPLTEVDVALDRIRTLLILIALGGIALAAALGLAVSRAALAPVRRLTATAENVTETGDLTQRIETSGTDELGRLATSFNGMLTALEESTRAQRQLVADASHELRTPLTSLRTNIEVLASKRALPGAERERLLSDVVEQLQEMTSLIAELIELARGEQQPHEPEDVRLDLLAAAAVERARKNNPAVTFTTSLDTSLVRGVPASLERALGNLVDNAAKWSPPGGEVEVGVTDGQVTVRDHGPGIADDDLPYVFDRFYRAASARGMAGSGLGLAIVKQVALAHGGEATAERAEDGGTLMTLRLNGRSEA